jgi:hypothetical protein
MSSDEWAGWRDVTPERPANPDLDAVRKLAHEAAYDIGFHETAIDDPFKAERLYCKLGADILEILGLPDGVRVWTLDDEAAV